MDILYALGRATGPEVQGQLADAPSYSTVRTILRVLERKGHVRHVEEGLRYVYEPMVPRDAARRSALRRLLQTFFDNSAPRAVAALLDPRTFPFTQGDLDELAELVEQARKEANR